MVTVSQIKNEKNQKVPENYWMTVLLYFAAFLVGLGIVAEVAANWQQIPNAVKLGGAVMLMVLNAFLLIWLDRKQKNLLKQITAVIYAFLIMGVIGLIGQVFQLNSNAANACLLWALISWPLFLIVPRMLWLWLPMFYVGMRFYNVIFGDIIDMVLGNSIDFETRNLFFAHGNGVLQVCGFIAFYGMFASYEYLINSAHKNNKTIMKPLRFYLGLLVMGVYFSVVQFVHFVPAVAENLNRYLSFFGPYFALALLIYIYNKLKNRFSFMPLFLIGLAPEALITLQTHSHGFLMPDSENCLPLIFLLIMTAYACYYKMPRLQKLSIFSIMIWFIITFEADVFDIIPSLCICAFFAFLAYRARSRKGFNTFVILAVLRILVYYADVENLEYLGLYLIGSGLLMIATILGLFKYGKFLWRNENEK